MKQLATLHSNKIVHLDINPDNVMFSPRLGRPVFIDFGLSELIGEECGFKT